MLRTALAIPCLAFGLAAEAAPSFLDFWQAVKSQSVELKALQSDSLAAEALRSSINGIYIPNLSSEVQYFHAKDEYSDSFQRTQGLQFSLHAQQNLFDARVWNDSQRREVDGMLGMMNAQRAQSELSLAVLQGYWNAVILTEKIRVYRDRYEPLVQLINSQGEDALREALRSKQDSAQWFLSLHQMQLQTLQNEEELADQLEKLKAMAGWDDLELAPRKASFVPDSKWIGKLPPESIKTTALQMAELYQKRAEVENNATRAAFLPRFFLFADVSLFRGSTALSAKSDDQLPTESVPTANAGTSYGIGMQWTLFDTLSSYKSHRASQYRLEAATWRLIDTQKHQAANSQSQRRRMESTAQRFKIVSQLRRATQDVVTDIQGMQRTGLRSFDAILVPLTQAFEAEKLYFQTLQSFFDLYWKQLKDLGYLNDIAMQEFAVQGLDEGT